MSAPHGTPSDVDPALTEMIHLAVGAAAGVPMSMLDGRPWVSTHKEAHPEPFEGCDLCPPSEPLIGLREAPGITWGDDAKRVDPLRTVAVFYVLTDGGRYDHFVGQRLTLQPDPNIAPIAARVIALQFGYPYSRVVVEYE